MTATKLLLFKLVAIKTQMRLYFPRFNSKDTAQSVSHPTRHYLTSPISLITYDLGTTGLAVDIPRTQPRDPSLLFFTTPGQSILYGGAVIHSLTQP